MLTISATDTQKTVFYFDISMCYFSMIILFLLAIYENNTTGLYKSV